MSSLSTRLRGGFFYARNQAVERTPWAPASRWSRVVENGVKGSKVGN